MTHPGEASGLKLFTTCPPSYKASRETYLREVVEVARWSEAAGCEGTLIYTDNGTADPWLLAQVVMSHTRRLRPLIAVQPIYMHPCTAAKMVATFAFLYGRGVYLNMVAGGFKNDLTALHDPTPHDERYARLIEYGTLMARLFDTPKPVSFAGRYYQVDAVRLAPLLPQELRPGFFVSGSSPAGLEAALALDALAVQYPKPSVEYTEPASAVGPRLGIRVGIVARPTAAEAWIAARERFPVDREGQLRRQLAMQVSDSEWHQQIAALSAEGGDPDQPYWTVPFENYKTSCPYLVGSYERVADEIARYALAGYRTIILDVPGSPADLQHTSIVCRRATERVTS